MLFRGRYYYLSNMYPAPLTMSIGGRMLKFTCSEAAYQAGKCPFRAHEFQAMNGYEAKRHGKNIPLRSDWEEIKLDWMREVLKAKFTQNRQIADMLVATGDMELIEENDWGDTYWGKCHGKGENYLGRLLQKLREELEHG